MKTITTIMKLGFKLLVLALILASCTKGQDLILRGRTVFKNVSDEPPTPPNDTVSIYLIFGQSNAAGRTNVTTNYVSSYAYLADPIILDGDTAFIRGYGSNYSSLDVLEAGVNSSDDMNDNRAGIQPLLGYNLIDYRNENVYFIQSALGGMAAFNWTTSSNPIYKWGDSTCADVRADFEAIGKIPVFKAFIWIQGETDGGSDTATYRTRLNQMKTISRDITETPDLPFILVQMIDCQSGVTDLAKLQALQSLWVSENASDNVYILEKGVDTDTCQDTLHFTFDKYLGLTERIFQLIKNL
jgi:hypothetical protein